jgi:hypothetical protein
MSSKSMDTPARVGNALQIAAVTGNYSIATACRALDYRGVNDIGMVSTSRQCADAPGLLLGERLGGAHGQQPGKTRLAWAAAVPRLCQHRSGHGRDDFLGKQAGV